MAWFRSASNDENSQENQLISWLLFEMKVVALLLVLLTLILSVNLRVSGVESSNKSVDEFSYNSFFHLLE